MKFRNRIDAGQQLARLLEKNNLKADLILAIPRGGIVVGSILSQELNIPLDIWLCKKIGHPEQPEYAIGSVCADGTIIQSAGLDQGTQIYFDRNAPQVTSWLQNRLFQLTGKKLPVEIFNKDILLVDDGVATGSTMLAAIQSLRNGNAHRIQVAIPLASDDAALKIKNLADKFFCLHTAENFQAVGEFYESFEPVTDKLAANYLNLTTNKHLML